MFAVTIPDWYDDAACRDELTDTFFPDLPQGRSSRQIKSIAEEKAIAFCRTCTVRDLCLTYALENRMVHGVWGGTTERQRTAALNPVPPDDERHGTYAGYRAHKKAGEDACRSCLDAAADRARIRRAEAS